METLVVGSCSCDNPFLTGSDRLLEGKGTPFRVAELPSSSDSGYQAGDADEGDGSSNVVGECRQGELAAHIFQPPHQECTLIHPLFYGPERVLNAFASLVQDFWSGGKARCHPV